MELILKSLLLTTIIMITISIFLWLLVLAMNGSEIATLAIFFFFAFVGIFCGIYSYLDNK